MQMYAGEFMHVMHSNENAACITMECFPAGAKNEKTPSPLEDTTAIAALTLAE